MITFGAANTGAAQPGNNVATSPQLGAGILIGGGTIPGSASTGDAPGLRPDVAIVLPDRRTAEALSEALRVSGFRIPKEFGSLRIIVGSPSVATPTGIPLEVGDLHSLQTLLSNPSVLMDALANAHAEMPVLLGSQTVFQMPQRTPADAPLAGLEKFLQPAAEARTQERGPVFSSSGELKLPTATDRGLAAKGAETALPKGSVTVEPARMPEMVRDVLVRLQILPPGVSTEQALPRFQEIARLWQAGGAQHADLPADVVRVVSNFFASVVLAAALPGQPAADSRAGLGAEASRTLANNGLNPLFRDGGTAGARFAPLTRNDIAKAVLDALQQTPLLALRMPTSERGAAQPNDVARQAPVVPQSGPGAAKGAEKDVAQVRFAEGARLEAGLDKAARDAKAPVRLSGDEQRERTEVGDARLDDRRAAHDQESHPGSGGEEDAHALEALWQELQAALEQGGFVTPKGNVRHLLDAIEGRSFLRLVAGRVPNGLDLIDVLGLIDARMGLSPEFGAVNGALHKLASYRTKWKNDKVRAILEPLHDAFVALEFVESGIIPVHEAEISAKDLAGFEAHAAVVHLLLDHPAWMVRTGADEEDRRDLEQVLPDVERLVEAVEEKFAAFANAQTRPEYFSSIPAALLN